MLKKSVCAVLILAFTASPAFATAKTYQVTGPVLEMNDKTITVQKGKEKWEIDKGSASVPAGVKVGDKVTIEYSMTADKVSAKAK